MTGRRGIIGIVAVLLFGMALAACGGGGGTAGDGGGTGLTTGSATIEGSLPGSVFVAVDNDTNLEMGRVTATGTPKTFSMNVPTGKTYRFYVMENEGTGNSRVYPMYMGTNNVFALDNTANGKVISLGMVSPDLATGRSTPANTPSLMTGQGATAMVPPTLGGSAFSMDNVKGTTWSYNTMMTSGTMGWEHGTLSFDNNGLGHMTGIVRNGTPLPNRDDIPYTMSLSGMLLNPGDNTFQCVVSRDMSVMVATFTDGTGGPAMMIGQKRGGVFQTDGSDMTGPWEFQRLTAGGDNTTSGWAYGTMQFTFGSAGITSMTTNTGLGGGGNFTFSMDANGIMSNPADASFHGVMSTDKSMIVATDTNGGDPELWVMMRTTTASTADMMGDWVMHGVSSGNPGSRGWTYGQSIVDASGNDTFTGMMGSDGPVSTSQMTFQMNGGVMTMGGTGGGMMGGGMMGGGMVTSTFHGITNSAKNLMVSTYTDGTGGYPFSIQMK
ncbi:hypothetical protein [Candidatus Deferrimicrobium sp.]|uniref:hypothetical protein n=1 Tax=Candidatus Deferrimicrobium sp. TaxID=3060586 RepID=UPI002ED03A17